MTATCAATAPWAPGPAQARMRFLEQIHQETTADAVAAAVRGAHRSFRHRADVQGLNLYAGSNVLSPAVADAHETALSTRPALGWPGEKVQPGTQEIEELEVLVSRQVALAMGANFAEVRFISATMANLAVYAAFTDPGDTIAILSPESGSHASHHSSGTAGVRGLRTAHLPYDATVLDVDRSLLAGFLQDVRPRLILVGGSVALFPHDLPLLRDAADSVGALLVYDASHTAGLIAAGVFQNPLREGAHAVTFSTYKTFAGPAGGAAVADDPAIAERLARAAYPILSSNYDASRLGPLAIAAAEAAEQRPAWAQATVDLARETARCLCRLGLPVLGAELGYTCTHQVVLDVSAFGGGQHAMRQLERAGLYAGACRLPRQTPGEEAMGLRLGFQEAARRGATIAQAEAIADLLATGIRHPGRLTSQAVAEVRASFGADIWHRTPGTD